LEPRGPGRQDDSPRGACEMPRRARVRLHAAPAPYEVRRAAVSAHRMLAGCRSGVSMTDADEQAEVKAFLADPASYPSRPDQVERLETHGALVFLAGDEAWKIKRAVRFPYMDLSTLEKRRAVCQREVEINSAWAPQIYLGCIPITRERDGRLAFGGDGEPVEWAVRMRRFPQSDMLGSIAERHGIGRDLACNLADAAFESHAT